jgi:hypothetical protein
MYAYNYTTLGALNGERSHELRGSKFTGWLVPAIKPINIKNDVKGIGGGA